jgi:hypothetical protein
MVAVRGVVTAEPGRVGVPALFVIQDDSSGIVVRLPIRTPGPRRGDIVDVVGRLAEPYGQREIRPAAGGLITVGTGSPPPTLLVSASEVSEAVEGRLVAIEGRIATRPRKAITGDLTIDLTTESGVVRVLADSSAGIARDAVEIGALYEATGVVGQRALRRGAADGYRVWVRDAGDLRVVEPGPGSTAQPDQPGTGAGSLIAVAAALLTAGVEVTIEADVTTGRNLLDASGRRIVVEDASAAVEVLLPVDGPRPDRGARVRVTGTIGVAYGAPRLRAARVDVLGGGGERQPGRLERAPAVADEWRLVRIAGPIVDVRRLGDRWLAEIAVGKVRVPVIGLPGAGIAATAIVEGRAATITGIVRRPYPSATDRRFAILPRDPGDIALGPRGAAAPSTTARPASTRGASTAGTEPGHPRAVAVAAALDVDLGQLAEHVGSTVRVGGLVVRTDADGLTLDDGTAMGRVVVAGEAAAFLPLLERGDAVNAIGTVERRVDRFVVVVGDPAGLLRVGDLGELAPIVEPPAAVASHDPEVHLSGLETAFGGEGIGFAGLASLVLATAASAAVGLARRERARRRLATRIATRLAVLGGDPGGPHAAARSTHES